MRKRLDFIVLGKELIRSLTRGMRVNSGSLIQWIAPRVPYLSYTWLGLSEMP